MSRRGMISILILLIIPILCSCAGNFSDKNERLHEICNWLEYDLWQDCLCEFSYYNLKGTACDGSEFDYDSTMQKYDSIYAKVTEYDEYIHSLEDKYSDIKKIWDKVRAELDILNAKVQRREIGHMANADFEVETLYKYINELNIAVEKL